MAAIRKNDVINGGRTRIESVRGFGKNLNYKNYDDVKR